MGACAEGLASQCTCYLSSCASLGSVLGHQLSDPCALGPACSPLLPLSPNCCRPLPWQGSECGVRRFGVTTSGISRARPGSGGCPHPRLATLQLLQWAIGWGQPLLDPNTRHILAQRLWYPWGRLSAVGWDRWKWEMPDITSQLPLEARHIGLGAGGKGTQHLSGPSACRSCQSQGGIPSTFKALNLPCKYPQILWAHTVAGETFSSS